MSAAASLAEPFSAIESEFEAKHDVDVVLNFGGSTTLAYQILEGAPIAVFAPADDDSAQRVVDGGLVVGTPSVFATNSLQLVVPMGNPARVTGLEDLTRGELVVGLCARDVPCGRLSDELASTMGLAFEADTREASVGSLLSKVISGDVDVALVYSSDSHPGVESVDFGAGISPQTSYPIMVLENGRAQGLAGRFVDFVLSPSGQELMRNAGFGSP